MIYRHKIKVPLEFGRILDYTILNCRQPEVNLENISLSIEKTIEILTNPFFRIKDVVEGNIT